jgi:hypothetical protein
MIVLQSLISCTGFCCLRAITRQKSLGYHALHYKNASPQSIACLSLISLPSPSADPVQSPRDPVPALRPWSTRANAWRPTWMSISCRLYCAQPKRLTHFKVNLTQRRETSRCETSVRFDLQTWPQRTCLHFLYSLRRRRRRRNKDGRMYFAYEEPARFFECPFGLKAS